MRDSNRRMNLSMGYGIKQGEFFVLKETMRIHRIRVQAWVKLLHVILNIFFICYNSQRFPITVNAKKKKETKKKQ